MIVQRHAPRYPRRGPSCLFVFFVAGLSMLGGFLIANADLLHGWLVPVPTLEPTRSALSYFAAAEQLQRDGDLEKAIVAYEAAVELEARNPDYYLALVAALRQHGAAEEAVHWSRKLTDLAPEDERGWTALAAAQLATGERLAATGRPAAADRVYQQAIAAANRAIQINPESAEAHAYLAGGLARSGQHLDFPKAQALAEFALALDPASPVVRQQLAEVYSAQGFYGDAIDQYETAIALAPDEVEPYIGLAYLYFFTNRRPQAVLTIREALARQPDHAAAEDGLGHFYFLMGDYALAEEHLRRAVTLDPELVRGHAHLGAALFRQQKYGEAIPALQVAVARYGAPGEATAVYFNMLGLAYVFVDPALCSEAVPLFEQVLAIAAPGETAALNARQGLSACGLGDPAEGPGSGQRGGATAVG